ncbi:hypothetical protein [Gordonia bronchialis]|uniref:hypothetical protein n=1 Tax=Gordonia bronchialis TaxID=2054 RepID=UPI002270ADE1|nr:hypothetical protein [Gordonia bronchialis]
MTALVSTVAHHSANVVPFPVIRPGVSGGFVSRENETYGSGRIEVIRPGVSGGFVSRENETYGSGRIEAILG